MITVNQLSTLLHVSFSQATYAYYFLAWKAIAVCSVVTELWLTGMLHNNNNDDSNYVFSFNFLSRSKGKEEYAQ